MEVTILYPFSTSEDNCDSFVKAIALARKKSAVLICFTVVEKAAELDEAYFHLLNLNGHYQSTVSAWKKLNIKVESILKVGDWGTRLDQCLADKKVDILINQPVIQKLKTTVVDTMIKKSGQVLELFSF